MARFLAMRAGRLAVSLLATMAVIFVFLRMSGDPISLLLPDTAEPETRAALAEKLGLDEPLPTQFVNYVSQFIRGDLGSSFTNGAPVSEVIADRIPATLELAGVAIFLTIIVAVPLGILSAIRHGTWVDGAIRAATFTGQSLPNFWVAIVLVLIFSVSLKIFPAGGRGGLASIVLPAITLSLYPIVGILRVLRSSMVESSRAEYVTFAKSKGLPRRRIVTRHILRNALIPTVTYGGIILVLTFLSGSIVIETVFAWPGIGRLLYESILARDFPMVQAIALLFTALYVVVSLAIDLLYGWLDPRTRS